MWLDGRGRRGGCAPALPPVCGRRPPPKPPPPPKPLPPPPKPLRAPRRAAAAARTLQRTRLRVRKHAISDSGANASNAANRMFPRFAKTYLKIYSELPQWFSIRFRFVRSER